MAAQSLLFPELEIESLQESLDKMRRKLFAEHQEMKKEIRDLLAHIEDLTWAVHQLTKDKENE